MSFREKMLWVSMVAVAAVWGSYLFDVGRLMAHGKVSVDQAYGGFIRSVVLVVIVQVVAAIVLAIWSPKDADAPADVRDKAIAASAAMPAYTLLSLLVVVIMLTTPAIIGLAPQLLSGDAATVNAIVMGNALLLALVLAHLVDCAVQIYRYRREA